MDKEKKDVEEDKSKICWACKKDPISYRVMPCRHEYLCRKCSMKMASGGKCKICKEYFVECQRIIANDQYDEKNSNNK